MKTFDKKDVYSWSNAEKARQYMRKEGYFADSIAELDCKIQGEYKNILTDIFASDTDRASCPFGNDDEETWSLFLPTEKVKEVEEPKKWRAFKDFNEFKFWTGKKVGSVIVYRDKLTNDELEAVITRSKLYENFVEIGAVEYTFKELFDQWEWLSNRNEWQPFGVEE